MPEPQTIRALVGQDVAIDCHDGSRTRGSLLNANRLSLWLVADDEDCFISVASISHLHRAS